MGPVWTSAGAALIAGTLSFLSPCIIPLIPVYVALLGGAGNRSTLILTLLSFTLGFTTIFVILGTSAGFLGSLLLTNLAVIRTISGMIIIVFGLSLLGAVRLPHLNREYRLAAAPRGGIGGAFVLGLAFAAGWTPCVGPVLATILLMAASRGSATYGAILLAFYSLGVTLPLLLTGFVFSRSITKAANLSPVAGTITGWLLVIIGLAMASGWLDRLPGLTS